MKTLTLIAVLLLAIGALPGCAFSTTPCQGNNRNMSCMSADQIRSELGSKIDPEERYHEELFQ